MKTFFINGRFYRATCLLGALWASGINVFEG